MGKPLPPHSVAQWHPMKNDFPAEKATAGSKKSAWWLCPECGHEWESRIQSHAAGSGCPQCRRKETVVVVASDSVMDLWSEKNTADPSMVSISEQSPARYWSCAEGHEWTLGVSAQRKRMVSAKNPCPVCAGRRKTSGSNYLVDYPDVASQWDADRNGSLDGVKTGSNKPVAWVCSKDHHWEESVNRRFLRGNPAACPECTRRVISWEMLVAQKPELDTLFSSSNVVAKDEVASASAVLSWKCPQGHTWDGTVRSILSSKGTGCAYCAGIKVAPGESVADRFPLLCAQWSEKNDRKPAEVSPASSYRATWECEEGHEWTVAVYLRTRGADMASCPFCAGSAPENALCGFVVDHLGADQVILRNRSLISPYELDIVVPDRKIAIEFHGLYWHGEAMGKDRNYHARKWELAKKAGYQLITIWEDDWNDRPDVVRQMLLHKLGISTQEKVHGRKTTVVELQHDTAHTFEDANHIQGASRSGHHIGLHHEGILVAVCSYSINGDMLTIDRYCTSKNVLGGFTKLLKHIERNHQGVHEVVTFADHEVSDGSLYARHNFVAEKTLNPDYKYVHQHRRVHKFNFRRARFRDDPTLRYEENLSEAQMAVLNGIDRVWDCGKTRYVKTLA